MPTDIDLSGAELELSSLPAREKLLRKALDDWRAEHKKKNAGQEPADYVLFDCPPSLGLLSLNALAASDEVFVVVQTQFLALQGMSKLVGVVELVKKELHPTLKLGGIVPCMYDSRMRLSREVLTELRRYFPEQVFRTPITSNVKLAESPSFGKTIFEYAPDSIGARDFASLAHEVLTQEVLQKAPEPEPRRVTRPSLAAVVQRVAASLEPLRAPTPPVSSAPLAPPTAVAPKVATIKKPAPVAPTVPVATPLVPPTKPPDKPAAKPRKPAESALVPAPPSAPPGKKTPAPSTVHAPVASAREPAALARVESRSAPKPSASAPALPPAPAETNGSAHGTVPARRPRSRATPST